MAEATTVDTPTPSSIPTGVSVIAPQAGSEDFVKVDPLKIKILDCRVLVAIVDYGNVSEGGILLPRGSDDKQQLTLMKVVTVGCGRTTDHGIHVPVRVKKGDYVIVGKYAGLKVGNTAKIEYKIINEVEILGVQEVEE